VLLLVVLAGTVVASRLRYCFCLIAIATIVGRGPIGSSPAAGDQRQRHRLVADPVK
jgi:hypothetical protein